ncbi:MAG: PspA/IM30 family protein, partial [Clostridiales bacterium]|nr:PspA/IM30 family protein [Clostridiales bacterium]
MGVLTRFKDIMTSNINALLDKAEDPEKMIDQCLRNLNSDSGKVKSETATIMAEEQRARRTLEEVDAEIEKMQSYAVKALEANNDADARKFLQAKAT